ncbi:MAG: hypothetical protein IT291_05950 [Deltaproteobacteria bacterium]|nr:hypothetical protein [Deltaproteobacteria bacterium]
MKTIFKSVAILILSCLVPLNFVWGDVEDDGKTAEPLSQFELGRYQSCGEDADCVKAVNGCCDCANGGQDVAVNKDRYDDFRARFDCVEVMCTELGGVPACGSGVVSCVSHKCRYVELSDAKM